MAKILGLDLGTNSIGWAVIDYERNYKKESFSIVEKGVHIFTEGVDKDSYGNPQSRAAERTDRRGARRLKFRRKLRKYETLKALIKHKMCPLDIEELEKWRSYKNPETGKIETFKHYPTSKEFFNWLNTDNQHDKVDRKLQKKNPYYFRDFASREKLFNLHELGRAFYHLAQRRGFLSNRLDKSDEGIIEKHKPNLEYRIKEANNAAELLQETETYFDTLDIIYKQSKDLNEGDKKLKTLYNFFKKTIQEPNTTIEVVKRNLIERLNRKENLGKVKEGIFDLSEKIKKENCKTLGQYFYKCFQEGKKIRKTYTAREEQYEEEFKEMCKVQGFNEDGEIYKDLHNAIFFQRKLKSQKGLVGKCTLEPNKPRCPISHPSFEEFRTLKFINNIKMKVDNEWRVLNEEEKKKIWHKFFRKSKAHFDFKEIAKDIRSDYPVCEKPTDEPDPKKNFFNYKGNATVTGCQTLSYLMDLFGKDWEQTNWKTRSWQDILENPAWKKNLFEKCMKKEIKSRTTKEVIGMKDIETVANDVWHALFIYDKESNLYKFAKNYFGADNIVANKFSSPTIQLKREYASFSLKAINNIIPFLREGLIETYAVFLAKMPELIPDKWSNEETQALIRKEIELRVETYKEEKRRKAIVNDLIKRCRDEHPNDYYTYKINDNDKQNIVEKIYSVYGEKSFEEKDEQEKNEIIDWVTSQVKKNEFHEIKRLDEIIKDFFLSHPGLGIDEIKANKLYHPSDIEKFQEPIKKVDKDGIEREYPGSPISGSIKNPTVFRALFQLRKLINELIRKATIDHTARVHIELTRELNDMNYRWAIEKWQKELEVNRNNYREEIKNLYKAECEKDIEPTNDEILKYQLWIEQEKQCVYTGKSIGICDFIGPNPNYDIAHTLPRSKTNDNSQENKTLALKGYNQFQNNRIPFNLPNYNERCEIDLPGIGIIECEAILSVIKKWDKRCEELDAEIEKKKRSAAANKDDKEKHDTIIREKHLLTFERNYWKDKYERFTMEEIPEGFTNRNLVDTGIITRYAQQWLEKYFDKKVHAVNGKIVKDFRVIWGLQKEYEKKERTNHIHHCIDAITIACITKDKYDTLARAYREEEKMNVKEAKEILANSKPWHTFKEDLDKIENEVGVTHQMQDNVPKQLKKKVRVRGKIQYVVEYEKDLNDNFIRDKKGKKIIKKDVNGKIVYKLNDGKRITKIQQGDTTRGPLHKESFYGAIKIAKRDEDNKILRDDKGNIAFTEDKDGNEIFYVIRKELEKLNKDDVEKIVDGEIKKIIEQSIKDKLLTFKKNGAVIKEGATIWQNEPKLIPIKKVRVKVSLKNPLPDFKKHRDVSKHPHKQQYNVDNKENYCLAIYEGENQKGKIVRDSELVNVLDAGEYYKLSNKELRLQTSIVKRNKDGLKLKVVLKKGRKVLLYKEHQEEIWDLNDREKLERLYIITGLDEDGIKLYYHQEARSTTDVLAYMNEVINNYNKENNIVDKEGKTKESKLSSPKGGDVIGKYKEFPYIKFKPSNFNALIQDIDFRLSPTGIISKL